MIEKDEGVLKRRLLEGISVVCLLIFLVRKEGRGKRQGSACNGSLFFSDCHDLQ